MAAYDFPDTAGQPTDGSFTYTAPDGTLYEWNGYAWQVPDSGNPGGGGGGDFEVPTQALPPAGASDGDMFWCTDDGRLYIYYEDADTSQWVDASPDNTSEAVDSYWAKSGTTLSPIDSGDSVDIGSGNITLNAADGSAEFVGGKANITTAGSLVVGTNPTGGAGSGGLVGVNGNIRVGRSDINTTFESYQVGSANPTIEFNADGSSKFAGDMVIGITGSYTPSTPAIELNIAGNDSRFRRNLSIGEGYAYLGGDDGIQLSRKGYISIARTPSGSDLSAVLVYETGDVNPTVDIKSDGSAHFKGNVTSDGTIGFNLEADDDTKYTATTNAEGEQTLVYNGAVLDVKESIETAVAARQAMRETFQELLIAVQSATDFAQLKAAMLVALEDYETPSAY